MFATISKPYNPWPAIWGFLVVSGAVGLMFFFQVFWPQVLKLQTPVLDITTFHVIRLTKPPSQVAGAARGRKEKPATAAKVRNANSPAASVIPGTVRWRQHVERPVGRPLDEHDLLLGLQRIT